MATAPYKQTPVVGINGNRYPSLSAHCVRDDIIASIPWQSHNGQPKHTKTKEVAVWEI